MQKALLMIGFWLLPLMALGDGKVFRPQAVLAETTIPDQRALLAWSNGVERLVIETRFTGEGTNFAWVVPLPNPPVIEEATSGMFTTLAYQMRPELVHDPVPWFAIILFSMAVGYLLLVVRPQEPVELFDLVACVLAGFGLWFISIPIALFCSVLLVWVVVSIRRGSCGPLSILAALFVGFLLGGMMLPTLARSKAGGHDSASSVTEVASERVGVFDTTTLAAKSPAALTDWLRRNGFQVATNAEPVIADYVKKGWVFVAAKLHRGNAVMATNAIHPLAFTFSTKEAVYPLRLTGVGNGPLEVELYVFGRERATADHFRVEKCLELAFLSADGTAQRGKTILPVSHPGLRRFAEGSTVVTKQSARLSPSQMREDALIRWRWALPQGQTVYSRRGALITAANWASFVVSGVALIAAFRQVGRTGQNAGWNHKIALATIGVGVIAFAAGYAVLPKVQVRLGRYFPVVAINNIKYLGANTCAAWEDSPPNSLAEARSAVTQHFPKYNTNGFLGGVIREEDSPGNYVVRQTTNGFDFIWFDADGGEHSMRDRR